MITIDDTLAHLAVSNPGASRVFKRYGLDFCCSGQRPLVEACRAKQLDPAAIVAELERESRATSADVPAPEEKSQGELVDFIVSRYHAPLREELPQLVRMAARVEARHGENDACPRGLADHLAKVERELLDHMAKEEQILFPHLRAGLAPRGPIAVMMSEHDDHGAALRRVRELTTDHAPPPGACATWRALYLRLAQLESELMDHIHLENNVLFPRALAPS